MNNNFAYQIQNLKYAYRSIGGHTTPVLDHINLDIVHGDFVAILGPSGSGKSTLMHLMGGMTELQHGEITLNNHNLKTCDSLTLAKIRSSQIGYVFQQFYLLPGSSVLDNILLPTRYPLSKKPDPKLIIQAKQLAKTLGIDHRLHHKPNELSGGEQQRTVIARALMNGSNIILADEPTGNLDSKNTETLLNLFKTLNEKGKTIIIITHDPDVAKMARRTIEIKDGTIANDSQKKSKPLKTPKTTHSKTLELPPSSRGYLIKNLLRLSFKNLAQKKFQSWLTALGVIIGVSSMMMMMTLGQFTKTQILASYNKLGAKTISFIGYPNWDLTATDQPPVYFKGFSMDNDLKPMERIFPDIKRLSPLLMSYGSKVSYAGQLLSKNGFVFGVNQYYLPIIGTKPESGQSISEFDVNEASHVCMIGKDIQLELFRQKNPIGKILTFTEDGTITTCHIIGIMPKQSTANSRFMDPNVSILVPYTFIQRMTIGYNQNINRFLAEVSSINQVKPLAHAIQNYFKDKYGSSGRFIIDPKTSLLDNIRTVLNIFTLMLAIISVIILVVAGIGITNMMLASIADRLHEVGLRKSFGATDDDMYFLYLFESIILCSIAGFIGLALGFISYETIIYTGSKFISTMHFEWLISPVAMTLAVASMLSVGILSGILPARKARKLTIVECLRK